MLASRHRCPISFPRKEGRALLSGSDFELLLACSWLRADLWWACLIRLAGARWKVGFSFLLSSGIEGFLGVWIRVFLVLLSFVCVLFLVVC